MTWNESVANWQQTRKAQNLWRERRSVGSVQQPLIEVGGEWVSNFSSNDYLGLAAHPRLANAMAGGVDHWGAGAGASHLVCGHQSAHDELELSLATFVGAERAVLVSNGYMANLAVCSALPGRGDLMLQDKLNHASLIDGAKLSEARSKRYAHADVEHANKRILSSEFNRLVIATDGVFSMDGDIAPLIGLKRLVDAHRGLLLLDDAHGFGVLGEGGRGTLNACAMAPQGNVLMVGTLGKALGSFGAFIAGDALYIEQIIQSARSYIYTTALPPTVALVTSEALRLLEEQGEGLQQRLDRLIQSFREQCSQVGVELMRSVTPIQPVVVGDEAAAVALSDKLASLGFLVPAIRTPTVPAGKARLRVSLTAAHTAEQVDALVGALCDAGAQTDAMLRA